ncbi:hypothetical protein C8Q73DRAFT_694102 [Cubamyces lactineus]|nr:hypothetical protein C8Q73DRAFT_694102 [Cubamyces lactineus]
MLLRLVTVAVLYRTVRKTWGAMAHPAACCRDFDHVSSSPPGSEAPVYALGLFKYRSVAAVVWHERDICRRLCQLSELSVVSLMDGRTAVHPLYQAIDMVYGEHGTRED